MSWPQLHDCDWMGSRSLWPFLPHARVLKDASGGPGGSTSCGPTCTLWCRQAFTRLTGSLEALGSAIYNAKETGWRGRQVILAGAK